MASCAATSPHQPPCPGLASGRASISAAMRLQRWVRWHAHRRLVQLARNTEDPITLDAVAGTPLHQLFTYVDPAGGIWAYDGPAWAQWILKDRRHPATKARLDWRALCACFQAASRVALRHPGDRGLRACLSAWLTPVRIVHLRRMELTTHAARPRFTHRFRFTAPRRHLGVIFYVSPMMRPAPGAMVHPATYSATHRRTSSYQLHLAVEMLHAGPVPYAPLLPRVGLRLARADDAPPSSLPPAAAAAAAAAQTASDSASSSSSPMVYQDSGARACDSMTLIKDGGNGFVAIGSNSTALRAVRQVLNALSAGTLTEAELRGEDEGWDSWGNSTDDGDNAGGEEEEEEEEEEECVERVIWRERESARARA